MTRRSVDREGWLVAAQGGRLVSLWGTDRGGRDGFAVSAAYATARGLDWVELPLGADTSYPDLSDRFPYAARLQRAAADLVGLVAEGAGDSRPWLDHRAWTRRWPLREKAGELPARDPADYPFVRVEGEGVHEIPVGPVHAGIIEPGHFRFSVVGEKVLRLEERLGYTHKGIERRFTELAPLEAHRLAGRVSGDATVAFAWAYCAALESACSAQIPARAAWLRALMLERERVANHLGDLGALGNDAGFAVGLAHFSRLREEWLRASHEAFGHRLMMDAVCPGGVAADVSPSSLRRMREDGQRLEAALGALRALYDEHAGLQDRFVTTGRVTPRLAAELGLTGLAGRASGQPLDLRCDHPVTPYDALAVRKVVHKNGDVAARVLVRFDEAVESLRLIRAICDGLPSGPAREEISLTSENAFAAGWIEGWRGEVLVALEMEAGRIRRCHVHDPSWQNWPVIEHAVIGNIVPDFPLINKSFNLSYSGHDL
ncbi:MAG TPA: NADH-quinone oxidoreductase subunit C [Burkholderiales bacterium]|nr:NADH-quinone oxidoreductase subunit C [Burkholderiales bacterium]